MIAYLLILTFFNSMYANDSITVPLISDELECQRLGKEIPTKMYPNKQVKFECIPYKVVK